MKKITFMLLLMVAITTIPVAAETIRIGLRSERIDHTGSRHTNGKAPVRIPVIYQDGHTISFQSSHPEYIINIVQDGDVVFTTLIQSDAEQYELPQYLTGNCIIQFVQGDYCFWAEIEL